MFCKICLDRILTDLGHYSGGVVVTTEYINKCGKLGVNKQQLYDSWVLSIREEWWV